MRNALINNFQSEANAFADIFEYLQDYKSVLRLAGINESRRDYPIDRCIQIASDRLNALENLIVRLEALEIDDD
mgnify:CR=1 FL=1